MILLYIDVVTKIFLLHGQSSYIYIYLVKICFFVRLFQQYFLSIITCLWYLLFKRRYHDRFYDSWVEPIGWKVLSVSNRFWLVSIRKEVLWFHLYNAINYTILQILIGLSYDRFFRTWHSSWTLYMIEALKPHWQLNLTVVAATAAITACQILRAWRICNIIILRMAYVPIFHPR